MQHFQRLPGCHLLEPLALEGIHFVFDHRFKCSSQRNKNRPHRFVFRSATRAGDARHPNRKIRAKPFARAFGHFARDRLTHRAVSYKCFGANAKKLPLRRIAVGHHSPKKNR